MGNPTRGKQSQQGHHSNPMTVYYKTCAFPSWKCKKVRVIGVVVWVSFRGIFGCFLLVWDVQWRSAYVRAVVREVQRGMASVGFRPEWSLWSRGRMGSPTRGKQSQHCPKKFAFGAGLRSLLSQVVTGNCQNSSVACHS